MVRMVVIIINSFLKTICMKQTVLAVILLTLNYLSVVGQSSPNPRLTPAQQERYNKLLNAVDHPPAYYLLDEGTRWQYDKGMIRANSLKSKAWILVAAGAALGGAGFLVPSNGSDYTKPAFFIVGGAALTTGIVCFTIVKKRKEQISLLLNKPPSTGGQSTSYRYLPQVGVRLNF
jgi:hypothetical protein